MTHIIYHCRKYPLQTSWPCHYYYYPLLAAESWSISQAQWTKDFVKPTAEGGQFINGNSHHPQTTFKSILFGEAIRLRRLNQRKDDYLSSLNRLKEKTIRSKFPLNMINDMIALASNWEDRLRPPKCDKKGDPQVWAKSFPNLLTLTQKEKKLNPKAMITYKRPTKIGQ